MRHHPIMETSKQDEGKALLRKALAKAGGTQTELALALGESRQLIGLWCNSGRGPPKWRHTQLRNYLETDQ